MTASELLTTFRSLGGIADNVSIRPSRHGHGLFVINPSRPVRLVAPTQLLISPAMLMTTREGQIKVKSTSGLRADVVAFHEHYQRTFGWGAGGYGYISQHRQQLEALPDSVKAFLHIFGCQDDLSRQLMPPEAFRHHCISRQISVSGTSRLMPVLELINHASSGEPYVISGDGVSLTGIFDDEVIACYRKSMDAFHFFFNYHFAAPSRSTLSCDVKIDVPGFRSLRVGRMDGSSELKRGVLMPRVISGKNEVCLSFVELVNLDKPSLPRQVFVEILKDQGMPIARSQELFDGLIAHNRQVISDFLSACEELDGSVLLGLKEVAAFQLTNLSRT